MIVENFIVIILVHFTTAQFPEHVDLQKVSEVTYKNNKYQVLKPAVHKITDYFEQFMLRSQPKNDGKIFIDNDGFRHFWSRMDPKKESFRKTNIKLYEINKAIKTKSEDPNEDKVSEGTNKPILRNTKKGKAKKGTTKKSTTKKGTIKKGKTEKAKKPTTTKKPNAKKKLSLVKDSTTAIATTKAAPQTTPKAPDTTMAASQAPEHGALRKVVTTTFFCPFLGVIKMRTILD